MENRRIELTKMCDVMPINVRHWKRGAAMQNLAKRTCTLIALAVALSPAMVRAQSVGTLDPTFGTGGRVTTDFAGAVVVQADGMLVMAGGTATSNGGAAFKLERFNRNG